MANQQKRNGECDAFGVRLGGPFHCSPGVPLNVKTLYMGAREQKAKVFEEAPKERPELPS